MNSHLQFVSLLLLVQTISAFQRCATLNFRIIKGNRYGSVALAVRRHTRAVNVNAANANDDTLTMTGQAGVYNKSTKLHPEIQSLVESLEAVKALPRIRPRTRVVEDFNGLAVVDPATKPTFRRLFTHDTWKLHLGGSTSDRWFRCLASTLASPILRAVAKTVLFLSAYAGVVSVIVPRFLSGKIISRCSDQSLPLSLCGNAIGLLLVFRTNHAYKRLEEARELIEKVVHLSGEIVSTLVAAWQPPTVGDEESEKEQRQRRKGGKEGSSDGDGRGVSSGITYTGSIDTFALASVCRHLASYAWSLRDELRDGETRDDVLRLLLPPKEAAWVASQRSRTLAIHGRLRRLLYGEFAAGRLPEHLHFILEGDLKDLASVASSCERIFTSPIPPTMSRHGVRSMTLWMLALPAVLAFSVPGWLNVLWTAAIAYVYLGIDELGVQVEQPFRVIPLWQLCQLVQEDILEFALQPLDLE